METVHAMDFFDTPLILHTFKIKEWWWYGLFCILNKNSITLFLLMMYNMGLFMLRMMSSCKYIFLPNFLSMHVYSVHALSTTYDLHYFCPRLCLTLFIDPRRLFSRVFSLLCHFVLCFLLIHAVGLVSSIFLIGVPFVLVNIPRKPATLFIHVVCLISSFVVVFYCCVSLVVLNDNTMKPLSPIITSFTLFIFTTSSVWSSLSGVHYCFFIVSLFCVVLNMIFLTNTAYKAIFSCNYHIYKS